MPILPSSKPSAIKSWPNNRPSATKSWTTLRHRPKQTEAQVKAAQAAVQSAKVNLGYTEIVAPISGVISRSAITEGALVSAANHGLTTIRQLSPVYVDIQRPAAAARWV